MSTVRGLNSLLKATKLSKVAGEKDTEEHLGTGPGRA